MKSSDAPDFDKQTSRVIVANATELKARPDVFVRFMRGYRDSLRWVYSTPEGLSAYANFAKLSESTAKRALQEFLPLTAVDPDRISGIEEVMADAVNFKFITAPLTHGDLAELIQIPARPPARRLREPEDQAVQPSPRLHPTPGPPPPISLPPGIPRAS